ncbi:MAG: DUF3795 domain-containing protein [Deltaproteobacteria bacterium]|nr:DUF3795 domain-containing protein [Candidatus Zymogenaceae bacterium]
MDRMIAFCGLICTDCPAYQATQADDLAGAQETAALWSKEYGVNVQVEDVWCDGCLVEGKKCAHCAVCAVRKCAVKRGVVHCGACADFACGTIEQIFAVAPEAREVLEAEGKKG